ncbi:MAG: 2-succinyl-6-hydroxy-2,4-cyclohexadiene-1-carboxylate synthase [bacterium]|nr:2-succinyl-6-hydroxy-2,4-cyclohexadiene-1-carboxylate synthase [bacterium]
MIDQRIGINGVTYHLIETGSGDPLVLLHGFMGSAAGWGALHTQLARSRRVIALDALGHGSTDAPPIPQRYRIEQAAHDLVMLFELLALPPVDLLGYSMGGRLALYVALEYPERLRSLVLESTSAGLGNRIEAERRAQADADRAAVIEQEGLETFIARDWETLPLFASQRRLPEAIRDRVRAERMAHTADGLANSLRGMSVGQQPYLGERLGAITMPALLIAGELDAAYCEGMRRMAAHMLNARIEIVPDAGHNVHLEQPAAYLECIDQFLNARR